VVRFWLSRRGFRWRRMTYAAGWCELAWFSRWSPEIMSVGFVCESLLQFIGCPFEFRKTATEGLCQIWKTLRAEDDQGERHYQK